MDSDTIAFVKQVRIFTSRLVQSLVQSRLGHFTPQTCTPATSEPTSGVWFGCNMDELGEVSAYLKKAISEYPPQGTVAIEFILYTSDGQYMPLEAWVIGINELEICEPCNVDAYHQMSTLLRSVSVAARMTPMHRMFVKKQDEESFIILYKVHNSKTISSMGPGSKQRRLGNIAVANGNLYLDLHYRMTMHLDFEDPDKIESFNASTISLKETIAAIKKAKVEDMNTNSVINEELTDDGSMRSGSTQRPKFILGQSTSSEESKNSIVRNVLDLEEKPFLAELRNHSFPFVSLLHSAYLTVGQKDKSPFEINNLTANNSQVESAENIQEEAANAAYFCDEPTTVSFIFASPTQEDNHEIGELLKQFKLAPDILKPTAFTYDICANIEQELKLLSSHKDNFNSFVEHINKITDDY
ncbi:unnamed protein product [Caenorhabditis bovis]|uniref:Autophagy-related protein 13 n=1 Tax=Caenorhabditis bovis TaxID=2654633 RepID=A0A8S1EIT7_9PELO|nr:unnamed protein product [Caenorhabditis bovis]